MNRHYELFMIFVQNKIKKKISAKKGDFIYTIGIKLSIFYVTPIFEAMKNNSFFGYFRHVHSYFGYQTWVSSIRFMHYLPRMGS